MEEKNHCVRYSYFLHFCVFENENGLEKEEKKKAKEKYIFPHFLSFVILSHDFQNGKPIELIVCSYETYILY